MHDSALSLNEPTWREIVEHHHSSMVDELTARLDSDIRNAVEQALESERVRAETRVALASEQARRSQAELLNQSLRRLRQASGEQNILQTLSESCAAFTESSVVLVFENNQARVVASPGVAASEGVPADELSFDIATAPAVVAAIESRDPVVALMSEAELSNCLAQMFGASEDGNSGRNAYLFPLTSRHSVVAMLIASGSKPLMSAPVELLCEAAGMRLETLVPAPERLGRVGLIQLTHTADAGVSERLTWDALSHEDQKLHLQAQRMARVRVAEMRLYHEKELREGIAAGDIYAALQAPIDRAREQFLQSFVAKSPTMVDYLHLQVLSSLANDDDRLLGNNYPGPMV